MTHHHPSITDWLTSLGTISAVAVALFGSFLRGLIKPKLSVSLDDPNGVLQDYVGKTAEGQEIRGRSRYYHVRVKNAWRLIPAHSVQVYLTRIEILGATGYRMVWAGDGLPLGWEHGNVRNLRETVGASLNADCLNVTNGALRIATLIQPIGFPNTYTEQCNLLITLQARSDERDTGLLRLRVRWDGQWHEGTAEMRQHLNLEEYGE
jgi:hypothetical protein